QAHNVLFWPAAKPVFNALHTKILTVPVPPRTLANSDKENSSLRQTANLKSSNPALTQNR
ncbi:hypothetical protein, partial [Caballeronia udeis]|uniref:hypothetical protein n=1 Tax=Caballeronia udeis TaxID=1232866 RepID=UPI001E620910